VTRRFDLTDAQWTALTPLWPVGEKPGRPPKWSKRQLIDGIRWRVRAGSPWRDVPECYEPWQTVYGLFRRWQCAAVWQRIVTGLQSRADAGGLITWEVSVDSTIARANQHAAGARTRPEVQKEPPGGSGEPEPADRALGRSREGWTTKLHLGRVGCQGGIALEKTVATRTLTGRAASPRRPADGIDEARTDDREPMVAPAHGRCQVGEQACNAAVGEAPART
jgi:transposase